MQEAAVRELEQGQPVAGPFPASRRRVLFLSLGAFLAGIAAAGALHRARYETFAGFVQAKTRTVTAQREARIAEILVKEGVAIAAGQPLLSLVDDELDARLAKKQSEVAGLEGELVHAESRLIIEIEARQAEIHAAIFDTKLRAAQFLRQRMSNQVENLAWDDLARGLDASTVFAGGQSDSLQSILFENHKPDELRIRAILKQEAALNATEVANVQIELCEERLHQLELQARELPEKLRRTLGVQLVQPRLDLARLELKTLEEQKQALTIVADGPGLVGVFRKGPGDHVAAHEAIVQLLDEEQPYLILRIPSSRIADFAPATVVHLQFPGGRTGKGRVEEIPPQTVPASGPGESNAETLLIAHIVPVGVQWPSVPFGTVVEVRRPR